MNIDIVIVTAIAMVITAIQFNVTVGHCILLLS